MDLLELPWLPDASAPLKPILKSLSDGEGDLGSGVYSLCNQKLTANEVSIAARTLRKVMPRLAKANGYSSFKLGILASATFDLLLDDMVVGAARHQVALDIVNTPYDQVVQEAMDDSSAIYQSGLDGVLVAVTYHWFGLENNFSDPATAEDFVGEAKRKIELVILELKRRASFSIILQTLALPAQGLLGSYESRFAGALSTVVSRINGLILEIADAHGCYVLDVAALSQQVGLHRWFDDKQWHAYKLSFSAECAAIYGDWLGRLVGAIRGKSRKVMVLDLDNTLWSGVIGDDGIEGIKIGQGSAEGEAHLALQKYAKAASEQGVILAVASKNDHANAILPFQKHPDMHLRDSDITFFKANWEPKHFNLAALAKEINVGIDSMVFVDDNAAERAQMRAMQPMVAVPEIGNDASNYVRYLAMAGYFEAVTLLEEDRNRNRSYAAEQQRKTVMEYSGGSVDYLSQLGMTISFSPFDDIGRQRIAQLINKSNQFNLTTRRYTEAEVQSFANDPNCMTMQVRLADKFGDFGMIGVIVAKVLDGVADIDTWLMSCRVLGRKVEEAMLQHLVSQAKLHGVTELHGHYHRTAKNGMVDRHYDKLGFICTNGENDNAKRYVLDVASFADQDLPHTVTSD